MTDNFRECVHSIFHLHAAQGQRLRRRHRILVCEYVGDVAEASSRETRSGAWTISATLPADWYSRIAPLGPFLEVAAKRTKKRIEIIMDITRDGMPFSLLDAEDDGLPIDITSLCETVPMHNGWSSVSRTMSIPALRKSLMVLDAYMRMRKSENNILTERRV